MLFKSFLSFSIFTFLLTSAVAQSGNHGVEQGEILVINQPVNYAYSHVNFPKANFIIKSGGRPDYSGLKGVEVEVSKVKTNRQGDIKVTLKRRDGKKFFGNFPAVTANYNKALSTGEIIKK